MSGRYRCEVVLTVADLTRDPAEVARSLPAWERGEPGEAIGATLELSTREILARAYVAWIWVGHDAHRTPVWLLPVHSADTERFAPAGAMNVVLRSLRAACASGADPSRVTLIDVNGFTGLVGPGVDSALAGLALEEHHISPARCAVAALPEGVNLEGPQLELTSVHTRHDGLGHLAALSRVHPFRIACALVEQGWELDEPVYPTDVAEMLRHRGLVGPPDAETTASLAIEDDPCPRRRHARRVLRRLFHARKIGQQYHTEFGHIARGVATDDRAMALEVGEALIRAGLLGEKLSVGQRHIFLRRDNLPAIHALIERGESADAALDATWTAPPPTA